MKAALMMLFVLACSAGACRRSTTADSNADASATVTLPSTQVPGPYSKIRVGMTEGDLVALFPANEDLHKCTTHLVGDDAAPPVLVPGADKKPRSGCLRPTLTAHLSGMTDEEITDLVKTAALDDVPKGYLPAAIRGVDLTVAQVRGSVRAGTLPEVDVIAVGHGTTAVESVVPAAAALFRGTVKFSKLQNTRRSISAVIKTDCSDLDGDRVRTYVLGDYALSQLDADAHSRVVNGPCRGPYLQHEHELQWRFVSETGALGAIGLARATRSPSTLDPTVPSTYAVYTQRSGLDAATARLGVQIANALGATEKYWDGTVALSLGKDTNDDTWGDATVWLHDGHVARVLVNFASSAKLPDLAATLTTLYGKPGATTAAVTTWTLDGGITARLDIGAAAALVVEDPKAIPVPTAATTTSSASIRSSVPSTSAALPAPRATATPAASAGATRCRKSDGTAVARCAPGDSLCTCD